MKIGIMSDTHDNLPNVERAIQHFTAQQVELIIHCGDWVTPFVPQFIFTLEPKLTIPIKSVFGNNEGDHYRFLERQKQENWNIEFHKETLVLDVDGRSIAVYHGTDQRLTEALIASNLYGVVCTGHTHVPVVHETNTVLHINPGSTAGYGFGRLSGKGTVAVYDTKTNKAVLHELA